MNGKTNNQTGGANMVSINRIFFAGAVISAAAAVFLASGCGVTGASGMQRAAEVRVATTLEAGSPKVIVSGPARLLHVDVRRPPDAERLQRQARRGRRGELRGQGALRTRARSGRPRAPS